MNRTSTLLFCIISFPALITPMVSCGWEQSTIRNFEQDRHESVISTLDPPYEVLRTDIETEMALQNKKRDFERYDLAGPYCFDIRGNSRAGNAHALIRDFVWSHWRNRGLGYVILAAFSKEGDPTASFFSIEANDGGVWCVVIKSIHVRKDQIGRNTVVRETIESRAYVLDRIEQPKGGLKRTVIIRQKDNRPAELYILRLKDNS